MKYHLHARYEGADLTLNFDAKPKASLCINNVERDQVASKASDITLKLTSVVQTAYEYHEFIQATIIYANEKIHATILAGDKVLVSKTIEN